MGLGAQVQAAPDLLVAGPGRVSHQVLSDFQGPRRPEKGREPADPQGSDLSPGENKALDGRYRDLVHVLQNARPGADRGRARAANVGADVENHKDLLQGVLHGRGLQPELRSRECLAGKHDELGIKACKSHRCKPQRPQEPEKEVDQSCFKVICCICGPGR